MTHGLVCTSTPILLRMCVFLTSRLIILILTSCLLFACSASGGNPTATDGDQPPIDGDEPVEDGDTDSQTSAPEPLAANDCGMDAKAIPEGCTSCHGAPPTENAHMPNPYCYRCHGYVIDKNYEWVEEERHANGTVDVATGCSSCHGWDQGVSPPQNLKGECGDGAKGIGAHRLMRRAALPAHRVGCSNCHIVPLSVGAEGHLDGDNKADVRFAFLAVVDGATPSFDGKSCSGVYCHGSTLAGGTHKTPGWYDTSGAASGCGACHRLTDPDGNLDADCSSCHPSVLDSDRNILPFGGHINGVIDLADTQR